MDGIDKVGGQNNLPDRSIRPLGYLLFTYYSLLARVSSLALQNVI